MDPVAVEREVYEQLYGVRSREVRSAAVSLSDPKPEARSKGTVAAERPAASAAGR